MKHSKSFWYGLLFLFMPAIAAHCSVYAPELIIYEWAIALSVVGFLLWSMNLLSKSEVGDGEMMLAECYYVGFFFIYIYFASYAYERGELYGWLCAIYTIVSVFLMFKLYSRVTHAIFDYARALEKGKYALVVLAIFWLFAFWLFFWFRVLNLMYLPSLLTGYVGVLLVLVSILSWHILKELPISFRWLTSSIYLLFYVNNIVSIIVLVFMYFEGSSGFYPSDTYRGPGYFMLRIIFLSFWLLSSIYTYTLSTKYDRQPQVINH